MQEIVDNNVTLLVEYEVVNTDTKIMNGYQVVELGCTWLLSSRDTYLVTTEVITWNTIDARTRGQFLWLVKQIVKRYAKKNFNVMSTRAVVLEVRMKSNGEEVTILKDECSIPFSVSISGSRFLPNIDITSFSTKLYTIECQ